MAIREELDLWDGDGIFDSQASLYESIRPNPYVGVPGLDSNLEWPGGDLFWDVPPVFEELTLDEGYSDEFDVLDFTCGDIVLAAVYQRGDQTTINPQHTVRPFLIIYANAYRVYGFQLTTSRPNSLAQYLVEIPNYAAAGLEHPCSIEVAYVRGISPNYLLRYIGHITSEQKEALLSKLEEIQENRDGLYTDAPLRDRLQCTIENVRRIRC